MKKFIKIVSLTTIIALLSAQFVIAETSNLKFSDLTETYWAFEGIDKLNQKGIIDGYPDGTFKPDAYITRAELVKLSNLVFSFANKQETTNLIDLKSDDWFYDQVLIAQNAGYIDGYEDSTFRPNNFITRQEFSKILDAINNFIELPMDRQPVDEVSPWAVDYVKRVVSNRIMILEENNNFRATENATRAEVCDALAKFIIDEIELEISNGEKSEVTEEQISVAMDNAILELSTVVIDNMTTEKQKEIVNDIINNMKAYNADNSHDYKIAAKSAYEKYKELSVEEREALEYEVKIRNSTKDLLLLQEFFFPDVDIK